MCKPFFFPDFENSYAGFADSPGILKDSDGCDIIFSYTGVLCASVDKIRILVTLRRIKYACLY